jgi:uncharacterized protein (DUF433 family)
MTVEQRAALEAVVSIDKGVMHGTPCFSGTRVPVHTLIVFLETGKTVDEFLRVYPRIPRSQVISGYSFSA